MSKDRMHKGGRLRAWIASLGVATVGLGVFVAPAQAVPATFWGVVSQSLPSSEQFQRLKRGGVDSIRVPVQWGSIQVTPGGTPDWTGFDMAVREASLAGVEVLPFVYGAPTWVVPEAVVPGSGGLVKAPKTLPVKTAAQRAAWSAFLGMAVARYGPSGSFWSENPTVPMRPIRTWQIGNEPNFKYFVARPNPVEFGQLVNISYSALRSVDPGAKIVLAGLFSEPLEATFRRKPPQAYFATDFLGRMYRSTPGIKRKFVGVALHPYTGSYKELTEDIEALRSTLKANHDLGKGLWITELGWSSQRPRPNNSFAKGRSGQKKQLQGAFGLLKSRQARWRVKRVYWFSVDDQAGVCNFCDGSGLFGAGFAPKPSWFAYVKFAGGTPN